MRILIACESSSTVKRAFAAKGHDAWSCDLRKQRDELLAVAKRLVGIIKAHDLESLSCDRDGHEFCECLGDAVVAARAAIANAEPQPKE